MVKIAVPGQREVVQNSEAINRLPGVSVTVKDEVRVGAVRAGVEPVSVEAEDGDIVKVTLEDGAVLWMRPEGMVAKVDGEDERSSGPSDTVFLGTGLPLDGIERGLGSWAIKGLSVLGVDLPSQGALAIAKEFEERVVPNLGLRKWTTGGELADFTAEEVPDGPWLVFLHGTASSTEGSFGSLRLAQTNVWNRLHKEYAERVFTLEHRTLTESPISNAIDLLEALPAGRELHVVSHSRGGLVGELLGRGELVDRVTEETRSPFDEPEMKLLSAVGNLEEKASRLSALLMEKRPKVTRFVRVACPARGTSLMGGGVDRWLNLAFNVAKLGVGGALNPVTSKILDALESLVLATVKERTEADTLPGLAAMVPDKSPLLQVLNLPTAQADDGLVVIAGDSEAKGALRRVALWFADLYFGRDHDLVVDTMSMDGGTLRSPPPIVVYERGSSVTHFSYFSNSGSAQTLVDGLLSPTSLSERFPPKPHDTPETPKRTSPTRSVLSGKEPLVFILPGISGSHLKVGDDRVWIDPLQLARGGVAKLGLHEPGVMPEAPLDRYYGDLCDHLRRTHNVQPIAYDWRKSIVGTAKGFAPLLAEALDRKPEVPVRIVAHSMGGLVARTTFALDRKLWKRFQDRRGSRLVMLGTPNGGSWSIPLMLLGRNKLMQWLARLDLSASASEHLSIVSGWTGAAQMLPRFNTVVSKIGSGFAAVDVRSDDAVFGADWWERLKELDGDAGDRSGPTASALAEAKEFMSLLEDAPADPRCMYYVAGQADTYAGIAFDETKKPGERLRFLISSQGDGACLWATGIPKAIKAWYSQVEHGDLARSKALFPAIIDVLERGETSRLPDRPPAVRRRRGAPETLSHEPLGLEPSAELLAAAAIFGSVSPEKKVRRETVTVSVLNGHLNAATHPVMVGHYIGDTINGTEGVLDRAQGGRISRRRARGLHPGPIETFDVHLDRRQNPRGSLVVGLGQVANLTRGQLLATVRRGLLALADKMQQSGTERWSGEGRGVSAVLVGSGAGVVALGDSVAAILTALRDANRILGDEGFTSLEIVEVVEQRSVSAWHAIRRRLDMGELGSVFTLQPEVKEGLGAWRRMGPDTDPDWWTTITINGVDDRGAHADGADGNATLQYQIVDGRARVEARLVGTQRHFVEHYANRVAATRVEDGPYSAGRTLFELLWPNALKEHSLEDRNLRLVLDEAAAALPWEMLDDRRPDGFAAPGSQGPEMKPPAVRHGVVRQLVTHDPSRIRTRRSGSKRALVIGDPRGGGSLLQALPGAEEEARLVARILGESGYETEELIGEAATPEGVVSRLFGGSWDIIHFATHGVFEYRASGDEKAPPQTGIVLGGDPLRIIDARMLDQLPTCPDLVFVNCCLLGKIDPVAENAFARSGRPALASGVAVQLIRMGVGAVIAAGWEVDDDDAKTFAERAYRGLLAGGGFGTATKEAREGVFDLHSGSSTWGAYQCYGDPDFRLPDKEQADKPESVPIFAAPSEALSRLEQIASEAEATEARPTDTDLAVLASIQEAVDNHGWSDRADILCGFAEAYAAFGLSDDAIERYAKALEAEVATLPISAIERSFNMVAGKAIEDHRNPKNKDEADAGGTRDDAETPVRKIRRSIEALDALIEACGPTVERYSLVAGFYKRLARVQRRSDYRKIALKGMRDSFCLARRLGETRGNVDTYYPRLQELAAAIMVEILDGDIEKAASLARSLSRTAPLSGSVTRLRSVALQVERTLLERVGDGVISDSEVDEITAAFKRIHDDNGPTKDLDRIVDELEFFAEMLRDVEFQEEEENERIAGLMRAIERICERARRLNMDGNEKDV